MTEATAENKIIYSGIYNYPGYFDSPSACHLDLYERPDGAIIALCTELADNPGTSITNVTERLYTKIAKEFNIAPGSLRCIERYAEESYNGGRDNEESLAIVSFSWEHQGKRVHYVAHHPMWRHITRAELETI